MPHRSMMFTMPSEFTWWCHHGRLVDRDMLLKAGNAVADVDVPHRAASE